MKGQGLCGQVEDQGHGCGHIAPWALCLVLFTAKRSDINVLELFLFLNFVQICHERHKENMQIYFEKKHKKNTALRV